MLLQRIVERVPAQYLAAARAELGKGVFSAVAREVRVEQLEDLELGGSDTRVVDQLGGAQSLEALLENLRSDEALRLVAPGEVPDRLDVEVKDV